MTLINDHRPYIIVADLCTNHLLDYDMAHKMLDACQLHNIIPKIQLYSSQTWPEAFMDLLSGRDFIASVFKPEDVKRIYSHKPLALKIASTESLHLKLLNTCMDTNLPLIISTGGMTDIELDVLYDTIFDYKDVTFLHCIALYPTPNEFLNIESIDDLPHEHEVGLSLHTASFLTAITATVAAMTLGARVFEYHLRPIDSKRLENESADMASALSIEQLTELKVYLSRTDEILGESVFEYDSIRPDRSNILIYRKRWNTQYPSLIKES